MVGSPKLNKARARRIRELWAQGVPKRELARRYGVGVQAVHDLVKGKTWVEAGGPMGAQWEVADLKGERNWEDSGGGATGDFWGMVRRGETGLWEEGS